MLDINQINSYYNSAIEYFKKEHPEFVCSIEDNCFVVRYNYKDATYLTSAGVSHEVSSYRHVVKIYPNGRFYTVDAFVDDEQSISLEKLIVNHHGFAGKSWTYKKGVGLGRDNTTGEIGLISYELNTAKIQKPVKEYFLSLGLKYKFFSYSLSVKQLDSVSKIVAVIIPIIVGLVFIPIGFSGLFEDSLADGIFIGMGLLCFLWGLLNIYCIMKKE